MTANKKSPVHTPPVWAERFLNWFCKDNLLEPIQGDLYEQFLIDRMNHSKRKANLLYYYHVINFLRPFAIKKITQNSNSTTMFKFFYKTFTRNLRRDKLHTFLNIAGLALGFAAFLYIVTYIFHETSYDSFHEKSDRLFRCVQHLKLGQEPIYESQSEPVLATVAKNELSEVEDAVRLYSQHDIITQYKDNKFTENEIWYADGNIFKIFDFKLLEGDPETVLSKPNAILLTKKAALKYFGDEDAIGKSLLLTKEMEEYVVSGILEDLPMNSHLQFDFLASFSTLPRSKDLEWANTNTYTYMLTKIGTDIENFSQIYNDFLMQKYIPIIEQATGMSFTGFESQGNFINFLLQPIEDIHLSTTHPSASNNAGNIRYLIILVITGIFILIIACFNFINLSTARASLRAKEIGVKKIIGSSRKTIIYQILTETFFDCFIALLISIAFLLLVLPVINNYSETAIEAEFLLNKFTLTTIISMLVIVTFLAGSYPAFYITRFKPIQMIKGKFGNAGKKSLVRGSLVTFQFAVFIILIFSTIIIRRQINLLQNQNPGFDKENVLVIEKTHRLGNHRNSFKNELTKNTVVLSASYSSSIPSQNRGSGAFGVKGSEKWFVMDRMNVDHDFQNTLKIQMTDGRFFVDNSESEISNVIINNEAAQILGWPEINEKQIYVIDDGEKHYFNVIGIIQNFHLKSLREKSEPLVMNLVNASQYLLLRLQPGDFEIVIETAKSQWEKFNRDTPFEYFFLDKAFDAQYKSEIRLGKIIGLFTIIAIIIACLGLFGLVSYAATQRRKEIGIRKINGATASNILTMLNKDFVKWIVIALGIGCPVAWYAMNKWLEDFAYKTALSWWIFALAGVSALVIALLTVSWQSYKAANGNPVEVLRYE